MVLVTDMDVWRPHLEPGLRLCTLVGSSGHARVGEVGEALPKDGASGNNKWGKALRLVLLIATGGSIPLLCVEGVPGLPGAPQDEAGLTRTKLKIRLLLLLLLNRFSRVQLCATP